MKFCPECGQPVQVKVPEGDNLPRHVCSACAAIHYHNPKIVVGCVPEHEGRILICRRLGQSGFEVLTAADSEEGLAKAVSEKPDLILMDMSLPVMDGWEATRQLKASEDLRAIPVIALTAHAMAGDEEKAFSAGCDAYETKPVELPRLLAKIESLLSTPGAP